MHTHKTSTESPKVSRECQFIHAIRNGEIKPIQTLFTQAELKKLIDTKLEKVPDIILDDDLDYLEPTNEDTFGEIALEAALISPSLPIVQFLLKAGCSLNPETSLHTVIRSMHKSPRQLEVLDFLLKQNLDVNRVETTSEKTPLQEAIEQNNHPAAALLLKAKANLNTRDIFGRSLLVISTQAHAHHTFDLLLEAKCSPDEVNDRGETLLMQAADSGNTHAAQALLARGVNPYLEDKVGRSVGLRTAGSGNYGFLEFLQKNNVDFNKPLSNGSSIFDELLYEKQFVSARYLMEMGCDAHTAPAILDEGLKSEKFKNETKQKAFEKDVKDFIQSREQFIAWKRGQLTWERENSDKSIQTYHQYLIDRALHEDKTTNLDYLSIVNCNFLFDPDKELNGNLELRAAYHNAFEVLKWFRNLYHGNHLDKHNNNVLMIAVQSGHENIVHYLLEDDSDLDLLDQKNNNNKTAYDLACEQHRYTMAAFLHQKNILRLQLQDSRTFACLPEVPLTKESFSFVYPGDSEPDLTPKGCALMLAYHNHKNTQGQKIFYVRGFSTLLNTIRLFAESNELKLYLLFDNKDDADVEPEVSQHRNVYYLQRLRGKIYIFVVDSFVSEENRFSINEFNHFLDLFIEQYPAWLDKFVFCRNIHRQQHKTKGCRYFSLKNINKIAMSINFGEEILANHIIDEEQYNGATILKYRLPARVMAPLTQSYDNLQNYIKDNPDESKLILRINKQGEPEDLENYVFHQREGFGIKTPEKVPNRNYQAMLKKLKEESNETNDPVVMPADMPPPDAFKNLSAEYFRRKYNCKVIPEILASVGLKIDEESDDENDENSEKKIGYPKFFSIKNGEANKRLRLMLEYRDANNLSVDPETLELDNKAVLEEKDNIRQLQWLASSAANCQIFLEHRAQVDEKFSGSFLSPEFLQNHFGITLPIHPSEIKEAKEKHSRKRKREL